MKRLDDILKRAEAATRGPWTIGGSGTVILDWAGDHEWSDTILANRNSETNPRRDAEFIAHARTDLPLVVEALKKAVEALNTLLSAKTERAAAYERAAKTLAEITALLADSTDVGTEGSFGEGEIKK